MEPFNFSTKAETLEALRSHLAGANIPPQTFFTLEEWKNNPELLINQIQNSLKDELLAVRSSSLNEDTTELSMAGNYKSILSVSKNNKEQIKNAIEKVMQSYLKDKQYNPKNQILIQPQVSNVLMSGVIFTRCLKTGSPYIIINYDDSSGKTDGVTSGNSSNLKTFTYFKNSSRLPSNENLANLIKTSKELEQITNNDALDIEFAINKEGIHILQVRPLAAIKNIDYSLDEKLGKTIEKVKQFITSNDKRFPNLYGYKAIFGIMPDWNPAEIIGESAKPLAFSLYKELITDYIWPLSRKEVGYKDVGYHPGIVSLGGKPYVDVRLSFNTFIPAVLSETTSEKLVNFYIDKLINNPEMHDKVEFKIVYTCYPFNFEKAEQELRQNNFSPLQIKEIKIALLDLTNKIVSGYYTSIEHELELNSILHEKRVRIMESDIDYDIKIAQLIHDCKHYGTLPFCKLARFAFVGNIILTSLIDKGVITLEDKNGLIRSINSIASEFVKKLDMLKKGEITKEEFIEEFGHLRPGTYDLCSGTYKEKFEEYFNLKNLGEHKTEKTDFDFDFETKNKITQAIKEAGFSFSTEQFLNFTRKAISAREKSKFEFSKNLSLILDYCYEYMKKYGFTKEDVTFLEINDLISFSHKSKSISEVEDLKDKVEKNKKHHEIVKALRLPPLVYMERSADYFHQFDNKPNYITNKSITGEIIYLNENTQPNEIDGKIVLITNADPGYDWVFGHNIKGLITKFGGFGSHMSIRCAEFNLPAAIGCGTTIFDYTRNFKQIELNCNSQQIKGVL